MVARASCLIVTLIRRVSALGYFGELESRVAARFECDSFQLVSWGPVPYFVLRVVTPRVHSRKFFPSHATAPSCMGHVVTGCGNIEAVLLKADIPQTFCPNHC